jgi:hypothetical protein
MCWHRCGQPILSWFSELKVDINDIDDSYTAVLVSTIAKYTPIEPLH